jgi:hypothetical protein
MPVMNRRSPLLLALALACAPASGCGGGAKSPSRVASTPAGEAGATQRAIAYARAVNLRGSDVPQMHRVSREHVAVARPSAAAALISRCAGGVSPLVRVADVRSARFARRGETVRSDVEIKPSAALAASDSAALRSPRGQACILQVLKRAGGRARLSARRGKRQVAVSARTPVAGVPRSLEVRVVTTIAPTRGAPFRRYTDLLAFQLGPAEISLVALGVQRPVASATERRLLALLYARAKATEP